MGHRVRRRMGSWSNFVGPHRHRRAWMPRLCNIMVCLVKNVQSAFKYSELRGGCACGHCVILCDRRSEDRAQIKLDVLMNPQARYSVYARAHGHQHGRNSHSVGLEPCLTSTGDSPHLHTQYKYDVRLDTVKCRIDERRWITTKRTGV